MQSTSVGKTKATKVKVGKTGKKKTSKPQKPQGKKNSTSAPVKSQGKNPLQFTEEDAAPRDRLSSINSSSASVREQLLVAQASVDAKLAAASDHVPLSSGKLKNLQVWIDSTDKKNLLDPQDFAGQQRREREYAGRTQQNLLPKRDSKRMSILLAFTEIESKANDDRGTDGSIAVGHDEYSSADV